MTILDIITYPAKILKEPTKPIKNIDQIVQELIEDMAETMYKAPGVGLAATQIGSDKSIIIYDPSPQEEKRNYNVLINPKIIEFSIGCETFIICSG